MARILIADDSDAIRLVLKDIMQIGHHQVVGEAINGVEAVKMYESSKPDIVLLDVAMPKKDGFFALKEIIAKDPMAKVIMITATDNLKTINDCISEGALAYILKPFDFEDVLRSINMVLEKHL
ncbi:MAG: response regulator [Thaumarchaeota archaeon]|nr:response regulator [Nitrososphaerota archaeon]